MVVPGIVLAASVDTRVVAVSSAMVGIVVTAETTLGGHRSTRYDRSIRYFLT